MVSPARVQASFSDVPGLVQKGLHAARLCFSPPSPTTSSLHAADPDLAWQKSEKELLSAQPLGEEQVAQSTGPPRADSKRTARKDIFILNTRS